jgi:glycine/D-amino acid oxidase-like deaminating enzyme
MKHVLAMTTMALLATAAQAQGSVYRCGNEYTNSVKDAREAQARGCKLVEGGNVTIIQAPRAPAGGTAGNAGPVRAPAAGGAPDNNEQRARDSDTRMILESELKKAEARQAELLREYNNGEPEKMGSEARNYQKYLDRVADLKASIARNDSDIAGIKRELARLPPAR